jgi:hypothetical protein
MQDRMEGTGRLLCRDERVCHFCSVCGFSKPSDTVFWALGRGDGDLCRCPDQEEAVWTVLDTDVGDK